MAKQTFTTGQVLTAAQMTNLQQTAMLGGAANARTASYVLVAGDAGNCVSMSNAGATTITVNTGIFAAGDIVTIINIGAGTCTITAGTATVSKPASASLALVQNAGGVLYFTATGSAIFLPFDTGVAGGSGLNFITRNSFSNQASVTMDNIFTSSYFNYLVICEGIYSHAGTTSDDLQMQLRYGSTTQTTDYVGGSSFTPYTGATGTLQNNFTTLTTLSTDIGSSTAMNTFALTFTNVGNTSDKAQWQGTLVEPFNARFYYLGGYNNTARTYTGLLFKSASSNITGVISVYGYAKA